MARAQQEAIRQAVATLDHPTADEVFFQVRKRLPRVALATIYRNLDQLVARGELRAWQVGGSKRYDTLLDRHAHLYCTVCDRLIDIPLDPLHVTPFVQAAESKGFVVDDQTVELQGLCADCKATTTTGGTS